MGSSGSRIRTNDLRVMSPTSYLCSIPHYCFNVAKLHFFSDIAKLFEHLFQKKFTSLWFTIAYFYYIRGIYIAIFDAKQLFEASFYSFFDPYISKKSGKTLYIRKYQMVSPLSCIIIRMVSALFYSNSAFSWKLITKKNQKPKANGCKPTFIILSYQSPISVATLRVSLYLREFDSFLISRPLYVAMLMHCHWGYERAVFYRHCL